MFLSRPLAFLALLASQAFAMPAPASDSADVHPSSFQNDDSHALDIIHARAGYPKMPNYVFKSGTCSPSAELGPKTERGKLDEWPEEFLDYVERTGEINIRGNGNCVTLGCSPPKTTIIACNDNRVPIRIPVKQVAIAVNHVTRGCFIEGEKRMGVGRTYSGGNWSVTLRAGDQCPKARFLP